MLTTLTRGSRLYQITSVLAPSKPLLNKLVNMACDIESGLAVSPQEPDGFWYRVAFIGFLNQEEVF